MGLIDIKEYGKYDGQTFCARYSDIQEMKDGDAVLNELYRIFTEDFYRITMLTGINIDDRGFHVSDKNDKSGDKYTMYTIEVGSGVDSYEMFVADYDEKTGPPGNERKQWTFSVNNRGYYIETTYNEVNQIMMSLIRNNKLNDLGI